MHISSTLNLITMKVLLKCTNETCNLYKSPIEIEKNTPLFDCPLCHHKMVVQENQTSDQDINWIEELVIDYSLWNPHIIHEYPSVLAYEYMCLHTMCEKKQPYGLLLCIKDNFESLLKYIVLLSLAWLTKISDDDIEKECLAYLTIPNLSLGSWIYIAKLILKIAMEKQLVLPEDIPLRIIVDFYINNNIIEWRNKKIGHGALELVEDEEFQNDIKAKLSLLQCLYATIDSQLIGQTLLLVPTKLENENRDKGSKLLNNDTIKYLIGSEKARNLDCEGVVYFKGKNNAMFSLYPYIIAVKHSTDGVGIYFFDNQRTPSSTHFLTYTGGKRLSKSIGYFERLRVLLDTLDVESGSTGDDHYLSEDEDRELDINQMSHPFIRPDHILNWLNKCLENNEKGIFLLQMERGTGKSVLTEKLNTLYSKPIELSGNPEVRTYHFGRAQIAGVEDIRSRLEWQWTSEFGGKHWTRASRISDFEKKVPDRARAFCLWLEEVQKYFERNHKRTKLLMVFDGLDEITNEDLWSYIPTSDMLKKGIYFLLTSRIINEPNISGHKHKYFENILDSNVYTVKRDDPCNIRFLKKYITQNVSSQLSGHNINKILKYIDYRILYLGIFCRLHENGVDIDDFNNNTKIISIYLDTINDKYGEINSIRVREVLAVLSTLGMIEPLSLSCIASIIGENDITLRLLTIIRDISPLIRIERGKKGNIYTIANPGLADTLRLQIPETEDIVSWAVSLTMNVIREGVLFENKSLIPVAANIVELASRFLNNGVEVLGKDADEVLLKLAKTNENKSKCPYDEDRTIEYWSQLIYYRKNLKKMNIKDILAANVSMILNLRIKGRLSDANNLLQDLFVNYDTVHLWPDNNRDLSVLLDLRKFDLSQQDFSGVLLLNTNLSGMTAEVLNGTIFNDDNFISDEKHILCITYDNQEKYIYRYDNNNMFKLIVSVNSKGDSITRIEGVVAGDAIFKKRDIYYDFITDQTLQSLFNAINNGYKGRKLEYENNSQGFEFVDHSDGKILFGMYHLRTLKDNAIINITSKSYSWCVNFDFSYDGRVVWGIYQDNTIRLWDIESSRCIKCLYLKDVETIGMRDSDLIVYTDINGYIFERMKDSEKVVHRDSALKCNYIKWSEQHQSFFFGTNKGIYKYDYLGKTFSFVCTCSTTCFNVINDYVVCYAEHLDDKYHNNDLMGALYEEKEGDLDSVIEIYRLSDGLKLYTLMLYGVLDDIMGSSTEGEYRYKYKEVKCGNKADCLDYFNDSSILYLLHENKYPDSIICSSDNKSVCYTFDFYTKTKEQNAYFNRTSHRITSIVQNGMINHFDMTINCYRQNESMKKNMIDIQRYLTSRKLFGTLENGKIILYKEGSDINASDLGESLGKNDVYRYRYKYKELSFHDNFEALGMNIVDTDFSKSILNCSNKVKQLLIKNGGNIGNY